MKIKLDCPYDFMDKELISTLDLSDNPECLIVNPGTDKFLDKNYFSKYKNLKVVGTPSTGVNHIDKDYLESMGIELHYLLEDRKFLNSIHASAEFTWLHIMNAVRKFDLAIRNVDMWRDDVNESLLRSNELHGKKLGIIGYGRIGRKISKYAKVFGLDVKFYDPYVKNSCDSIEDLSDCDIVSINCYLTDETKNMISWGIFDSFKDNLIVINTSRGEVVDEKYIAHLVMNYNIFYSCDVLNNEQDLNTLKTSYLFNMVDDFDNLVITPHVAGATKESQQKALESILKLCIK
tara:strand:- start:5085 stop:5957 length:873 start_codon:yes stop_codon:yes gene_type:complete